MRISALVLACVFLGLTVFVSGCGGGISEIDGKVVKGDKPYSKETDGELSIDIRGDNGKQYSGSVEADGTFKIQPPKGEGAIPPGKYSISITQYPTAGELAKLKGSPRPTNKELTETWDVSSTSKSFTLDVTKVKK